MAYPTISGPYGLKPTGKIGGRADAGANRNISIASGYATDIFFGDPVGLTTAGTIEFETPDAAMAPVGVFLGCFYTDATSGPTYSQYWPASTVAADAVAYVCDDPDQLFKVAVVSSGTTIGDFALTDVGLNAAMVNNAGSTVTGNSKAAISDTAATTNTLPLRIVDLVEETKNSSGGFTEAIVKWNVGHSYNNTTGV
jgi:hypothetical protein